MMKENRPVELAEERVGRRFVSRQLMGWWDEIPGAPLEDVRKKARIYNKEKTGPRLRELFEAIYEAVLWAYDQDELIILQDEWWKRRRIPKATHPFAAMYRAEVDDDPKRANQCELVLRFALVEEVSPDKMPEFVREKGGITKCAASFERDLEFHAHAYGDKRPVSWVPDPDELCWCLGEDLKRKVRGLRKKGESLTIAMTARLRPNGVVLLKKIELIGNAPKSTHDRD